jgi:hypothetical protein
LKQWWGSQLFQEKYHGKEICHKTQNYNNNNTEVMAVRSDIIIIEKESAHCDRCGDTSGQKYRTKRSRKETKYMIFCV